MAVLELTLCPFAPGSTSVSPYVAKAFSTLKKYYPDMDVELTPMGTIMEGELPELYDAVLKMQEAVFDAGVKRVYTVIKIDDRRDKPHPMREKVKAVMEKVEIEDR